MNRFDEIYFDQSTFDVFSWMRRLLRVVAITSQCRILGIITAQNRLVKTITSQYRKVKSITSGG